MITKPANMTEYMYMRLSGLFLLAISFAFAQSDGILTSVSRNLSVSADQADFTVVAVTGLDFTADQVTQTLQTAGLQNLSLAGSAVVQNYDYATGSGQLQTQAVYQLNFSVTAAAMKDTAKKLEALRTSLPETLKNLQFSAFASASQAAVDAARQTVLPLLLADAQKKAQSLAAAAGVKLGAVKAVSESSYSAGGSYQLAAIVSVPYFGTSNSTSGSGTQYTFYATVTFTLAP
jgi:uncharacterized protein YggE